MAALLLGSSFFSGSESELASRLTFFLLFFVSLSLSEPLEASELEPCFDEDFFLLFFLAKPKNSYRKSCKQPFEKQVSKTVFFVVLTHSNSLAPSGATLKWSGQTSDRSSSQLRSIFVEIFPKKAKELFKVK